MCTIHSLDPRELQLSWENICKVLNVVNARVLYLEGCIPPEAFLWFACGIFSGWRTYTVVDPVLQSLEDESHEVDSKDTDDSLDILDLVHYPVGGAFPASRPLPMTTVAVSGNLIPPYLMPMRGTAFFPLYLKVKDSFWSQSCCNQ